MRNAARPTALGAVLLLALGAIALPAAADPTDDATGTPEGVVCDDVLVGQTLRGPLVVPEESTCIVDDVVVVGDVHVGLLSDLLAFDLTVTGDILIDPDAYIDLEESSVEGSIDGDVPFGASLVASNVDGDVRTRLALIALVLDSDVAGDVNLVGSARGNTDVLFDFARVAGDVRVDRPALADVFNSTLEGSLEVRRSLDGSVVCTSEVDGDAVFADGRGVLDIGAASNCQTNYFGGDLDVLGHQGTPVLEGNIVRGDLNCDGNTDIFGSGNRVRGVATGQCETLEPAPEGFGTASVDGVDERRERITELRESRRGGGDGLGAASAADAEALVEERRDEIAELRGGATPSGDDARSAARDRVGRG